MKYEKNFAMQDGKEIKEISQQEIRKIIDEMFMNGRIIAVIMQIGSDYGMQIFGPPRKEILDCLQEVTKAYEQAYKREVN